MCICNGNALVCVQKCSFFVKERASCLVHECRKGSVPVLCGVTTSTPAEKKMGNLCCHVFHYQKVTNVKVFLHLIRHHAIQE